MMTDEQTADLAKWVDQGSTQTERDKFRVYLADNLPDNDPVKAYASKMPVSVSPEDWVNLHGFMWQAWGLE